MLYIRSITIYLMSLYSLICLMILLFCSQKYLANINFILFFHLGVYNNWIANIRCSLYRHHQMYIGKINRYPSTLDFIQYTKVRSRTWRRARPLAVCPSDQYRVFLFFYVAWKPLVLPTMVEEKFICSRHLIYNMCRNANVR